MRGRARNSSTASRCFWADAPGSLGTRKEGFQRANLLHACFPLITSFSPVPHSPLLVFDVSAERLFFLPFGVWEYWRQAVTMRRYWRRGGMHGGGRCSDRGSRHSPPGCGRRFSGVGRIPTQPGDLPDGGTAATVSFPGQELIGHAPVAGVVHAVRQFSGDEKGVACQLCLMAEGCYDGL